MTTIAYRDGIIASDSRLSTNKGYVCSDTCKKLFKLKDGAVLGLGGHNHNGLVLLHELERAIKESKKPEAKKVLPKIQAKGVEAILVSPNGEVHIYEQCAWGKLEDCYDEDYYALGSGSYQACAVMDMGADAITAVKQGIRRDVSSGGRVQSYKVF